MLFNVECLVTVTGVMVRRQDWSHSARPAAGSRRVLGGRPDCRRRSGRPREPKPDPRPGAAAGPAGRRRRGRLATTPAAPADSCSDGASLGHTGHEEDSEKKAKAEAGCSPPPYPRRQSIRRVAGSSEIRLLQRHPAVLNI